MPLHITFNPHDAEALAAIVGPVPEALASQWSTHENVEPGTVQLDLDGVTNVAEMADFDPLTAGIVLARYAQQDDREALKSWPLTGDLDFEGEHYRALIGCPDEVVRKTAQSYALMTEIAQAIEDGAVEIIELDPDTLLTDPPFVDAVAHDHIHPETLTEHGGEG